MDFCWGQGQGINNWWLMGYESYSGIPFGITKFDFFGGSPAITFDRLEMEFMNTHANISDAQGNLLFYTNGYCIADATNDTMQNESGINPGYNASVFSDGFTIPQACLIIPLPGSNNIYYLFHNNFDGYPSKPFAYYFYVTMIDMNMNNGLGAVTFKNSILLSDSINSGKITACKHGNGRDWWVVCHRVYSDVYHKFLVTPSGISVPFSQSIGHIRQPDVGQAKFSPDGSKVAYYYNWNGDGLDVFDFDRCTGNFSNPVHISFPTSPGFNLGVEFSPDSKKLYVMDLLEAYQFDLTDSNDVSTQQTIAVWDSFYSPQPPLSTLFAQAQLGPDGKIYITTGNSTFHMHVINNPDSLGLACDFTQHSIQVTAFYYNTVPNHPNYFLAAYSGSVCDTLQGLGIEDHLK